MGKVRATSTKRQREQLKKQKKEDKLERKKARDNEKLDPAIEQVDVKLKKFIEQSIAIDYIEDKKKNESLA